MSDTSTEPQREQWSSRPAYIIAAIGAAIGFGNVWRFPNYAYDYGGGAFFIPYLLALFFIGIPILILETAIGQFYQTGDAGAFGRVHKRFRGLGLASVFCGFILNTYYCVLIAWVCRMFIYSCAGSEGRWAGRSGEDAYDWFLETVTGYDSDVNGLNFVPTRLVGWNVLALAFVWLFIYFSLAFGVKWSGRISYVTVGLPIIVLIILLIRGATLPGARDGIRAYIGEWDLSVLSKRGEVWSQAVSQVFFSIGVTLGILTAYASYNERNSPAVANSFIIALSNSFFSFIAGFSVFCTVGYIAFLENKSIDQLQSIAGPGLMFGTYPVALSTLPGGGHWERLFFVSLFFLGIDSAFALAEAVTTVFHDSVLFHRLPRMAVTAMVCLLGFLSGLLYCTDTGFYFLDVVDYYVNFMLLLIGFFECFAVGWIFGLDEQIRLVGAKPTASFMMTSFLPVILASGIWFGLGKRDDLPPAGWSASDWSLMWGFIALILSAAVGIGITVMLCIGERERNPTAAALPIRDYVNELLMGNVLAFRRELHGVINYLPYIWLVLIRHGIPQVLLVLFANLVRSENQFAQSNFGNYGGYSTGYQSLGVFVFVASMFIIVFGMILPDAYSCFSVKTIAEEKEREAKEEMMNMESVAQQELAEE